MPYIDNDPTAPNNGRDWWRPIVAGNVLVITGALIATLLAIALIGGNGTDGVATTPDIMTDPTTTTTVPAIIVSGTPPITAPTGPTYENCEEDEILAPLTYGNPTHYTCVVLDDFADPASIDRLDTILNERRANG